MTFWLCLSVYLAVPAIVLFVAGYTKTKAVEEMLPLLLFWPIVVAFLIACGAVCCVGSSPFWLGAWVRHLRDKRRARAESVAAAARELGAP